MRPVICRRHFEEFPPGRTRSRTVHPDRPRPRRRIVGHVPVHRLPLSTPGVDWWRSFPQPRGPVPGRRPVPAWSRRGTGGAVNRPEHHRRTGRRSVVARIPVRSARRNAGRGRAPRRGRGPPTGQRCRPGRHRTESPVRRVRPTTASTDTASASSPSTTTSRPHCPARTDSGCPPRWPTSTRNGIRSHPRLRPRTIEDFREIVPVNACATLSPQTGRMAGGARGVLTTDGPKAYTTGGGSTAAHEELPVTRRFTNATPFPFHHARAPLAEHFADVPAAPGRGPNGEHDAPTPAHERLRTRHVAPAVFRPPPSGPRRRRPRRSGGPTGSACHRTSSVDSAWFADPAGTRTTTPVRAPAWVCRCSVRDGRRHRRETVVIEHARRRTVRRPAPAGKRAGRGDRAITVTDQFHYNARGNVTLCDDSSGKVERRTIGPTDLYSSIEDTPTRGERSSKTPGLPA